MEEIIIIDDIDVSGCKYYKEELSVYNRKISTCTNCGFCTHNISELNDTNCYVKVFPRCRDEKDCYYKQLKRKEKEIEQYKQALREIKGIVNYGTLSYDDLPELISFYVDYLNDIREIVSVVDE